MMQAYRDLTMDPREWILKRVLPVGGSSILISLILMIVLPEVFLNGLPLLLLAFLFLFSLLSAILFPLVLRERRRVEIEEQIHLFIIRIGVLSLSSSTRTSIYEHASREKGSRAISAELEKVRNLSRKWKMSIPEALRLVGRTTPSKRFGDFIERMAYAIETDEDPKVFFRNEQDAVLEEYKSRYSNILDRIEVVREVYISMVSVTMFLNVMLVVLSLLVGINHYLVSFLIVFIFILVEIILWIVVDQTLPRENIWYTVTPSSKVSSFQNRLRLGLVISILVSTILGTALLITGPKIEDIILYLAIATTPLMVPGFMVMREESMIIRRDEAFGAFIRILGATAESRGGIPLSAIKRLRWHDFGPLSEQIRNLYDRLETRIDQESSWNMFVKESRSELISQFMNTYLDGIRSGGSPKEVSTLVSNFFTSLGSLRKRRYLMADNFTGILYGLTLFISGGLFMIESVVEEMIDRLGSLNSLSENVENLQPLVLLKDVPNLGLILMLAITSVILVHIAFASLAARRFRGSNALSLLLHVPGLLWAAAIAGYLARFAVGQIL
jgi:flagellar protein FlaJ